MAAIPQFQFRYSFERDMVEMYLKVSFAAAGAPTIVNGKGIQSIVRNSAGNYTILLVKNYNLLLDADHMQISSAAPAATEMRVISEQVNNVSSPSLIVQFSTAAGAATDPASGEVAMIRLACRNAST